MTDPILTRLTALKTTPTPQLKEQWRQLFEGEPPAFNRRYLESRLAYRIQELAYGGLKPETLRRLEKLGEELDGGRVDVRKRPANDRPISGTRLIRDYQGVEHCVTVRDNDFEYQGRAPSTQAGSCAAMRPRGQVPSSPSGYPLKLRCPRKAHEGSKPPPSPVTNLMFWRLFRPSAGL